ALRTWLCFRPGRDGCPGPWGEQGFTRSVTVFSGVRPEERLLLFGSAPMDGSRKLTPLVCPGNGGNERKVGTHSCPCSAPGWVTHARTQNGAPQKWRKAPRHSDGQILLRGGQAGQQGHHLGGVTAPVHGSDLDDASPAGHRPGQFEGARPQSQIRSLPQVP